MRKITSGLFTVFALSICIFGCTDYLRGLQNGVNPNASTQPTQITAAQNAGEKTNQAVTAIGATAGAVAANTPPGSPVNSAASIVAAVSGVILLAFKYAPIIAQKVANVPTTAEKIDVIHDAINASVVDASKSTTPPPTT